MTEVGARLRDGFFALWRDPDGPRAPGGEARAAARERLLAEVEATDAAPTTRLHGLSLSYFPSARFKQLRFVEAALLDDAVRPRFARPCAALPELAAAFVDPRELSYRSFENIVGLDRLFRDLGPGAARLTRTQHIAPGVTTTRLELSPTLGGRLALLDTLDLYVRPSGAARGGERYIFHSAELAATLTAALRETLPRRMLRGFVHVNPVFRCNRFEPGDAPFASHVDSPYYHRARHHVSKYTLLLYLTGGRGESLRFAGGPALRDIAADTAVVFAQGLVHEGRPYTDARKVFLRTELIFEDPQVEHAPGVAEVFARACYLGGESVFTAELARHADDAYNRAAAAHWRGPPGPAASEPYLYKQFRGAHFVTNGYDYWFHRGSLGRIECAALALLDLLNAHIAGAPFRGLCTTTVHHRGPDDRAWISALLREQAAAPEPVFARLDKQALVPEPEEVDREMGFPSSPDFDHTFPDDWDATRSARVIAVYAAARRWALRKLLAAPITMLGKELFLDPDRFIVVGDKIHVLSSESLGPVHFAGAVWFDPEDFVGVDATPGALQPLAPPMWFREDGELLHLCCDLFRNSWMVGQRSETVPVPRVLGGTDLDPDTAPWLRAAGLSIDQLHSETK